MYYWESRIGDYIHCNEYPVCILFYDKFNFIFHDQCFPPSTKYNIVTTNRSLTPLDLSIMICPYKFYYVATVDHHENSMLSSHCITSAIVLGKHSLATIIWFLNAKFNHSHNSSSVYILLYKLIVECLWPDHKGRNSSTPVVLAHVSFLFEE